MGGRLETVARLERVFAHGAIVNPRALVGAEQGINEIPQLVSIVDDLNGELIDAVLKPISGQAPQEAFASGMGRMANMQDLLAVTHVRQGQGILVELAPGAHPTGLASVTAALRARHGPAPNADELAQIDLHRVLGFDWIIANPDRHHAQMMVSPTGLLAFDHGHIGAWNVRATPRTVVPMQSFLFEGVVSHLPHEPSTVRLHPEAVASLLEDLTPGGARDMHRATLGRRSPLGLLRDPDGAQRLLRIPDAMRTAAENAPPPVNNPSPEAMQARRGLAAAKAAYTQLSLVRNTFTARDSSYIGGVMERIEHLRATGEIHAFTTGATASTKTV